MEDQVEDVHRCLNESFLSLLMEQELLAKVIEFFPYPIQIFSLDGTARMINKAALEMIGIKSMESHVGKYNVFEDPVVRELGFMDQVRGIDRQNRISY
jgi:AraC family transcriptional regulator